MHPVLVYLVVMAVVFALAAIVVNTRVSLSAKTYSYKLWRK